MDAEIDPFDFLLAEKLCRTVAELGHMPNAEYLAWRAFHVWRAAMEELEGKP